MLNVNKEENRKAFKLIFPFVTANSDELLRIAEMSEYININGAIKLITGDNPFISNNKNSDIENILGEFFFPLSYDQLFIAAKKVSPFINLDLLMHINLTIFHQSERFVCSHDIDNLNYIIIFYKLFKEQDLLNNIVQKTFEILSKLTHYENFK